MGRRAAIVGQAVVGFLKVQPRVAFPRHRHLGDETVVVVQGALRHGDGTVARLGDAHLWRAGSEHAFEALPGPELIYLVVIRDGVAFGDVVIRPGSPDA